MAIEFRQILFPTDFSDLSVVALGYAARFAEAFGARLHCLHVIDEAYQYWSSIGPESIPVGPPPEDLMDIVQQRMNRFAAEHLEDLPQPVVTQVEMGRPFAEIIRYASEQEIDLIVMATHGRGALAHALLGSTTEKVVRKACCAVMTVRADEPEQETS